MRASWYWFKQSTHCRLLLEVPVVVVVVVLLLVGYLKTGFEAFECSGLEGNLGLSLEFAGCKRAGLRGNFELVGGYFGLAGLWYGLVG